MILECESIHKPRRTFSGFSGLFDRALSTPLTWVLQNNCSENSAKFTGERSYCYPLSDKVRGLQPAMLLYIDLITNFFQEINSQNYYHHEYLWVASYKSCTNQMYFCFVSKFRLNSLKFRKELPLNNFQTNVLTFLYLLAPFLPLFALTCNRHLHIQHPVYQPHHYVIPHFAYGHHFALAPALPYRTVFKRLFQL